MVRIRPCIESGIAVIGVTALVLTPSAPVGAPGAPAASEPRAVALAAQVQPLPTALASLQPLSLLGQQVSFHVAFVGDFLVTGAVLFAREFAIPGALLQDIQGGTPLPVAVGRALQTFAGIELEAGARLVGFAAQYISFQVGFLTHLIQNVMTTVGTTTMAFVTFALGVVGQLVSSVTTGLTPATSAPVQALSTSAAPADVVTTPRVTDFATSKTPVDTAAGSSGDAVGAASNAGKGTGGPKKPKVTVTVARDRGEVTHPPVAGIHKVISTASGDTAADADKAGGQRRQHDATAKRDRGTHDAMHGKAGD